MNNLQQKIKEKIENGEVTMIPRWQFVLRSFLYGSGVLVSALIAVYILSFILFALHRSGVIFAPLYGWNGIVLFIVSSPWLLILLLGLFLFILYVLVRHYEFSYKKPLIYSLIGVVLAVVAIASLIQQTPIHDRIGAIAEERNLPGLAPLYKQAETEATQNVFAGTITELTKTGLVLEQITGRTTEIKVTDRTRMPRDRNLEVGQAVLIIGSQSGDSITALGIRPADDRQQRRIENAKQKPRPIR